LVVKNGSQTWSMIWSDALGVDCAGGADRQRSARRHRISCVDGEVEEDLHEVPRLESHVERLLSQIENEPRVLTQGTPQERLGLADHVADVANGERTFGMGAGQGQELVGEARAVLGRIADRAQLAHAAVIFREVLLEQGR